MKKIYSFVVLIAVIASLCACGKETITMQDVYNAGLSETLLENHESVYAQYVMNGEIYGESYLSKEFVYDSAYGWSSLLTDQTYHIQVEDSCERILLISPDGLADVASYRAKKYASVFFGPETEMESIQSVTKKDNRITVASVAEQEQIEAMAAEDEGLISCNFEYVLDAKTRDLISAKGIYCYDDGAVFEFNSDFVYNREMPERAKALLEYDLQTEDLRTITVISNPGTENEKSQSVQVPKGLPVALSSASDADGSFEIYDDAACTELHIASEDHTSDVTLYVKWGE